MATVCKSVLPPVAFDMVVVGLQFGFDGLFGSCCCLGLLLLCLLLLTLMRLSLTLCVVEENDAG